MENTTEETATIKQLIKDRKDFPFWYKHTIVNIYFDNQPKKENRIDHIEFEKTYKSSIQMNVREISKSFIKCYTYILNHPLDIKIPISEIKLYIRK